VKDHTESMETSEFFILASGTFILFPKLHQFFL